MTEQEARAQARKEKKRAYHREWQRKNRDKCQEYQHRHFEKKVERYLLDRLAETERGEIHE